MRLQGPAGLCKSPEWKGNALPGSTGVKYPSWSSARAQAGAGEGVHCITGVGSLEIAVVMENMTWSHPLPIPPVMPPTRHHRARIWDIQSKKATGVFSSLQQCCAMGRGLRQDPGAFATPCPTVLPPRCHPRLHLVAHPRDHQALQPHAPCRTVSGRCTPCLEHRVWVFTTSTRLSTLRGWSSWGQCSCPAPEA